MSQGASTTVTVPPGVGLHARPAALFVQRAAGYASSIRLAAGGREADGKSILALLQLGAGGGAELTISAEGTDAEAAVAGLAEYVRNLG
ncbi:MAG: Phosphocarrier protein NPr [Chloroflexota bacterium]